MKTDDSFYEYEGHLDKVCDRDCFYCGREEDILEWRYRKAQKLGELTWEDVYEY